jgi:hypothetical protein
VRVRQPAPVVARRERDEVVWNQRFLHLRGHYAFQATACTPATPREKGSVEAAVRYLKSGFWPARRFNSLGDLDSQYADWRDEICNQRRHASGRFPVEQRLKGGATGACGRGRPSSDAGRSDGQTARARRLRGAVRMMKARPRWPSGCLTPLSKLKAPRVLQRLRAEAAEAERHGLEVLRPRVRRRPRCPTSSRRWSRSGSSPLRLATRAKAAADRLGAAEAALGQASRRP